MNEIQALQLLIDDSTDNEELLWTDICQKIVLKGIPYVDLEYKKLPKPKYKRMS